MAYTNRLIYRVQTDHCADFFQYSGLVSFLKVVFLFMWTFQETLKERRLFVFDFSFFFGSQWQLCWLETPIWSYQLTNTNNTNNVNDHRKGARYLLPFFTLFFLQK